MRRPRSCCEDALAPLANGEATRVAEVWSQEPALQALVKRAQGRLSQPPVVPPPVPEPSSRGRGAGLEESRERVESLVQLGM